MNFRRFVPTYHTALITALLLFVFTTVNLWEYLCFTFIQFSLSRLGADRRKCHYIISFFFVLFTSYFRFFKSTVWRRRGLSVSSKRTRDVYTHRIYIYIYIRGRPYPLLADNVLPRAPLHPASHSPARVPVYYNNAQHNV